MGDEKKEALAMCNQNSVTEPTLADSELKTSHKCIRNWVAKQVLPLKGVVRATVEATWEGACRGFSVDVLLCYACSKLRITQPSSKFLSRCGEYQPLVRSLTKLERNSLEQMRNWAVMGGVNAAISCVLKNIKGKEDVSTSMVAGLGYGIALSLVTGMRGPKVMSVGVICALISGGLFKLDKLLLPEQAEDALHNKKKGGFASLCIGLDPATNFNKDLLAYNNLPLLSDGWAGRCELRR